MCRTFITKSIKATDANKMSPESQHSDACFHDGQELLPASFSLALIRRTENSTSWLHLTRTHLDTEANPEFQPGFFPFCPIFTSRLLETSPPLCQLDGSLESGSPGPLSPGPELKRNQYANLEENREVEEEVNQEINQEVDQKTENHFQHQISN